MDKKILKQDTSTIKNWYADRYAISVIQRNLLFLFCLASVGAVIVCLFIIKSIIEKNSIEPYLLKVEGSGQMPVAVNVEETRSFVKANHIVVEYFLTQYLKARETYDPNTYQYSYTKIIPAFSSTPIYEAFIMGYVQNSKVSPITNLAQNGRIDIEIKQVVAQPEVNSFTFRIVKTVWNYGNKVSTYFFQITIKYTFDTTNMNYELSMLNPLGLRVISYEVLDEKNIS